MREAVLHLSGYQYQNVYGVNYRVKDKISMADLSFRVQHVIKTEIDVAQAAAFPERSGGTDRRRVLYRQSPRASGKLTRELRARRKLHRYRDGRETGRVSMVPYNNRTIINSDQILSMPEIPKTLIVVGGGVIGVEYACMFSALGVRVTLIEKRPRLLEFADAEIVEALCYHLRDHRVTLRLNEGVASRRRTPR